MELKPTKIAILCNYELLPERVGGMDYFFWMFDERCKKNNIEVDWFFPNTATHGNYASSTIISSNYENVEHFFANYISRIDSEYSTIITHFVEVCSPIFKKIKKLSNAKIIVVDHNPRPLNGYSTKKKIEKKLKGLLYSKYINEFIGVSKYTTNAILKDFGNHVKSKTKTIYNGVTIDEIKKRTLRSTEYPTFLVASHLRKSKGIQDLICAVSLLSEDIRSKIVIDVYGDGPYKSTLLNLITKDKLTNNFNFKGSVSNLKELYCNYDYMLQPTHMECFSLSILESLAANVPVITTNVGGNEEAVINMDNGIIFKAGDSIALSEIITNLVNGKLIILSNTRTVIEDKFSLERMVDNYINLLT